MLQGQRHGHGSEYSSSGEIYTGSFHNGCRQGFGRLQYAGGDVYEGQWRAGVHHGLGTCMFASGDVFEGSYINGSRQGLGILLRPSKVDLQAANSPPDLICSAVHCPNQCSGMTYKNVLQWPEPYGYALTAEESVDELWSEFCFRSRHLPLGWQ